MMTDRWLNYVLAVVVVLGLAAVVVYERPRIAQERAEFLDQEVAQIDPGGREPIERDPLELRRERENEAEAVASLGNHGVTASHPAAVEVGMGVLDAGGNAVDAAIAVAYTLGVVEPFGSGIGGGGTLLIQRPGEEPTAYDYREIAPLDGQIPASRIGVPGFVAAMERIHADHGTLVLADLIEPAARLADDGVEVTGYLHERLRGAGHRLPVHRLPGFFPDGMAIAPGETLYQPEYAEALRQIQEEGAAAMYDGSLGEDIVGDVNGLSMDDFRAYEVHELEPAVGTFAGYDVVSAAAPASGPTLVQMLQVAQQLGILDQDLDGADAYHTVAQSWRVALAERTERIADTTVEDVPLDLLLGPGRTEELAALIPVDGFAAVAEDDLRLSTETDTTHVVVVDDSGTMVSMTNTLSNFFGSGQTVRGIFLNDQLKNFSAEADSINHVAPGKRPRSFVTPTIVVDDGRPVLGIGSPGGRRIPMMVAQVLVRWAGHGQDIADAVDAPRFHLEGRDLQVEEGLPNDVVSDLNARGYRVTRDVPTTEYFGSIQALFVDQDTGEVRGVADDRRIGDWAAARG